MKWTKRKRSVLLLVGAGGMVALVVGLLAATAISIEGTYSGEVLGALSDEALFVMQRGEAFIREPDGDLVLYGHYRKTKAGWRLSQPGGGAEWIVQRGLWRIDMICSTNDLSRYRFSKLWWR